MKQTREPIGRQIQRWIVHALCDALMWAHDQVIEYACARNLWRTDADREVELPPKNDEGA